MLLTVEESLRARPERLAAKSQKFYDITPYTTISARQKELVDIKVGVKVSIEEFVQWLDGLWLNRQLQGYMTEEEYLEFRKAIQLPLK